MKYLGYVLFLLICLAGGPVEGQGPVQEITFDAVYRDAVFTEADVTGLWSMNDGEHFTVINGQMILKMSYRTGKYVDVVVQGGSAGVAGRRDPGGL